MLKLGYKNFIKIIGKNMYNYLDFFDHISNSYSNYKQ